MTPVVRIRQVSNPIFKYNLGRRFEYPVIKCFFFYGIGNTGFRYTYPGSCSRNENAQEMSYCEWRVVSV